MYLPSSVLASFSALMLLAGRQEGHLAREKLNDGCWRGYICLDEVQICVWPS